MIVTLQILEVEVKVAVLEYIRRRHEDLCAGVSQDDVKLYVSSTSDPGKVVAEVHIQVPTYVKDTP